MEVKHLMKIATCPNDQCKSPIRLSEGTFVGGNNDRGGIIIECSACKTVFPCKLKNPYDASRIVNNGTQLDSWTDDLPDYLKKKHKISSEDLHKIEISLVFGYEKPPKPVWKPSSSPLFEIDSVNFEEIARNELQRNAHIITANYNTYYHWYVKGNSTKKSFVMLHYEYNGTKYKAVFAKQTDVENELNISNLYLINHSGINFEYQIDGIYKRNQLLVFLERFLNRWRYSANEVLLVVPFIGFNYKNSEEALYELWNWLEINVDISKTNLITRKGTFNLFKKAQDNSGILFEELVRLGLLEPLIEKMNKKDTAYFQKSHAKYYVGVYENHVEVLSGSFNIHQGEYFENMNYRRYEKEFFKKRYLHMFKNFEYAEKEQDQTVHYMTLGTENDKNFVMGLDKLLCEMEKENAEI